MPRSWSVVLAWLLVIPGLLLGQSSDSRYFVGGSLGVSTLSADGKNMLSGESSATSSYKPENGLTFQFHGGRHLTDYVSLQASYGWNRNSLMLSETRYAGEEFSFYEQTRSATQQSVVGEVLVYFRKRESRIRPYLSAGGGFVHLSSPQSSIEGLRGALPAPAGFSATKPAVRIAVGIDVFLKDGFAFRFIFSETIRRNDISQQLTPQGDRNLAHFQNLFGFVKYF